nr:DUF1636 domain-containing protein [Hoeflea prorocentri]
MSVCTRCRQAAFSGPDNQRPGYRLAKTLHSQFSGSAAAGLGMSFRGVRCMSQCKRPCVVALSGPSKYTLVFGDLHPQTDAEAILELAEKYATTTNGFVERADRPEALRAGILGRIPPLNLDGDPIDPDFTILPAIDKDIL